ncbi:hypothetical protein NKR23_g9517 [Pleurostoma richardsiae]|uniref:Uncharacterized protein n=1 Tax=Pleurostoma richardsiae TaxID=41990 RepID=A0AA38VEU1_9PEZI|nr:hypothetical protein NKR23_g9517 [Pleurostoma richardsiae]
MRQFVNARRSLSNNAAGGVSRLLGERTDAAAAGLHIEFASLEEKEEKGQKQPSTGYKTSLPRTRQRSNHLLRPHRESSTKKAGQPSTSPAQRKAGKKQARAEQPFACLPVPPRQESYVECICHQSLRPAPSSTIETDLFPSVDEYSNSCLHGRSRRVSLYPLHPPLRCKSLAQFAGILPLQTLATVGPFFLHLRLAN